MDVNLLRGALLVGLIIGFVGIFVWAWSRKRKPEFDQAARLPLEEDIPDPVSGIGSGTQENKE